MPGLLGGLASLGGKKSRKLKELQPTLAEVMNADEDGNTPMHHACEQNEVETAKQIIERVRTMNDGETKLKQLLLLKNHDGETPIMLALDAAGDSDTGDSSLKLLLGGICLQLKMLPEMFSSSSASEADGIWNRPGFKLPEMGALLVATDKGSLIDDDGNELVGEGEPYVEFLNEYAELPHEGIGLIVAKAFLEEFDEATGWKRSTPWKQASGTYHTPSRLGGAFARVCELAQDAAEAATMCEADYRISEAEKYKELSARVQVAASTCMDYLGNNVAFAICCSVEGDRALNLACQTDQVDLLCTKAMNGIMLRKWRGKRLHERLEATANESNLEWFFNWLYFVFLVASNVAILPLAAATPPLSKYRDYGWAALFPPGGYLLQTAFFQASVFAVTDLLLTLNLTFHRLEDSFFSVLFGFAWAVGALFYELHQVQGRQTTRSGQSFVEEIKSYVRQDPFNLLDLAALSMAAFAYFCTTIRMLRDTVAGTGGVREQMAEAAAHFEGFDADYYFETVGSVAVLLMWFRQLRLLMIVREDMAPIVMMMAGMLSDVFKFIQLLLIVLFGFAGAMSTLFLGDNTGSGAAAEAASHSGAAGEDTASIDLDGVCHYIIGADATYWTMLKTLFEGSLLAESPFIECVKDSDHPIAGLLFVYGFMILSVVLLLNMIIAMMGKTFDRYWERAQEEAAAGFASMVQDWEGQQDMPAPLNLLSFPYFVIKTVMWGPFAKLRSWCEDGSPAGYKMHEDSKKVIGSGEKTLRLLTLGDKPGGLADLEELKDMIADNLNEKFGQHEDTGTLIDNAVKTLDEKIDELQTDLLRALEKQTKTIEARFAAMPARK